MLTRNEKMVVADYLTSQIRQCAELTPSIRECGKLYEKCAVRSESEQKLDKSQRFRRIADFCYERYFNRLKWETKTLLISNPTAKKIIDELHDCVVKAAEDDRKCRLGEAIFESKITMVFGPRDIVTAGKDGVCVLVPDLWREIIVNIASCNDVNCPLMSSGKCSVLYHYKH